MLERQPRWAISREWGSTAAVASRANPAWVWSGVGAAARGCCRLRCEAVAWARVVVCRRWVTAAWRGRGGAELLRRWHKGDAAARFGDAGVRVRRRGSGWFKEPGPKIPACGIGREGCGYHGRGSRGDAAGLLQRGEGGGRGRDCQVGPACQWWGARERLSGSLWVGPASHEWRGGVRGWGTSGLCGAS